MARRNSNVQKFTAQDAGGERFLFDRRDRQRLTLGDLRAIIEDPKNANLPDDLQVYLGGISGLDLRSPRRGWTQH